MCFKTQIRKIIKSQELLINNTLKVSRKCGSLRGNLKERRAGLRFLHSSAHYEHVRSFLFGPVGSARVGFTRSGLCPKSKFKQRTVKVLKSCIPPLIRAVLGGEGVRSAGAGGHAGKRVLFSWFYI